MSLSEKCECECVNHVVAVVNHDDDDDQDEANPTNDDYQQDVKLIVKLVDYIVESGKPELVSSLKAHLLQLVTEGTSERKKPAPSGDSSKELLKKEDCLKPDKSLSAVQAESSSSSKEKPLTIRRRQFTKKDKDNAWERAGKVDGFSSDHFRVDRMGNLLYRRAYGKPDSLCSWEIDHSKCLKHGGTCHKNNIQSSQNKVKNEGITPEAYKKIVTDVDKRCPLFQRDEILLRLDGGIDESSAAVQDGLITLNKDGTVRANCRAVTNKELTFKKENNQLQSSSDSSLSSSSSSPSPSPSSHITPPVTTSTRTTASYYSKLPLTPSYYSPSPSPSQITPQATITTTASFYSTPPQTPSSYSPPSRITPQATPAITSSHYPASPLTPSSYSPSPSSSYITPRETTATKITPSYYSASPLTLPSYSPPSRITSQPTTTTSSGTLVGYYSSAGSANGREVYQGPRGGNFYLTASGNKRYV